MNIYINKKRIAGLDIVCLGIHLGFAAAIQTINV